MMADQMAGTDLPINTFPFLKLKIANPLGKASESMEVT